MKYVGENSLKKLITLIKNKLDTKVDKKDGKGLSTNDYTSAEKTKLAGIATGANKYRLPVAGAALGGIKSGTDIAVDKSGNVSVGEGVVTSKKLANDSVTKEKIAAGATYTSVAVTLTVAGWSSNAQTVSVAGVTADNAIIVCAAPASLTAYGEAGVYCSAQAAEELTFTCTETPSADLIVNILMPR